MSNTASQIDPAVPDAPLAGMNVAAEPPTRRRSIRAINFAGLVAGLGLGQGSLFLAQTWLVNRGKLPFLGQFGLLFAFATLGILLVDLGALTSLARRVAHPVSGADPRTAIWQAYAPVTVVRLSMAVAVMVAALVYVALVHEPFSEGYAVAALPAFVVWAFNGAGLLDGLQRSGASGLAQVAPYFASALLLPFAATMEPHAAGLALGAALSVGYAVAVLTHFTVLRWAGLGFVFMRPNRTEVVRAAKEGLAMTAQWLPAAAFYRVQILLCGFFLGAATVGLFVYARQITNALSQVVAFVRRVEFPTLVRRLTDTAAGRLGETFNSLRGALAAAALTAAGLVVFALVARPMLGDRLAHAAGFVAVFSPLVFTGSLSATVTLGLFAQGRVGAAARAATIAVVAGLAATLALAPLFGITGFVAAEVGAQAVGVTLMVMEYRRDP